MGILLPIRNQSATSSDATCKLLHQNLLLLSEIGHFLALSAGQNVLIMAILGCFSLTFHI